MVDIAQGDICRYYGGTKPLNNLAGGEVRNGAQITLTNCYTRAAGTSAIAIREGRATCSTFIVSSFHDQGKMCPRRKGFSRTCSSRSRKAESRFARMRHRSMEDDMAMQVEGGWLNGELIRRVRKPGRCDYWRGKSAGGRCDVRLEKGDLYVVGEHTDSMNPYQQDRYCLRCAGPEAQATVAKFQCEAA